MSFQGPGTGLTGTAASLTAGYAQSAGNINGTAPTATYANNLAVQGIGASTWAWAGQPGIPNHYWGSNQGGYHAVWQANQGYVGYAGSAGNINGYAPSAGYAQSAGNINGYAPSAGYANQASNVIFTQSANATQQGQFGWQGQNTTPSWLWGGNLSSQSTVFAPGNLSVGYAGTAGYTNGNIGGNAPNATYAGYAGSAGNINGYAPVAGNIYGYAPSAGVADHGVSTNYLGSGAQFGGANAFSRAGRSRDGGTYGYWAAYNQQTNASYANFNAQFGTYWSIQTTAAGNAAIVGTGSWQGNTQIYWSGGNSAPALLFQGPCYSVKG